MQTKIENVSSIKRKISVDVPAERVADELEKAYQKIQKTAKLKGFREGKVPRNMLEQYFKSNAEKEAIESLISATYSEALEKENVNPVSRPKVDFGDFDAKAQFSYTAEFEIHPVVEVDGHHGLSLEKTERTINDELVDKRLKAIQQSMTQLEPADENAKLGEGLIAYVDFNGTADGKPFNGSKAENFLVDVGAGSLLKEFEDSILGMKKGESKKIEFVYPKDYFNKDLAGKKGTFDVNVKDLKLKRVPELNDDFAKDLGNYKNLDEVKADLRKRMESAVEYEAKTELANQAMELLVKKHQFEVPEAVILSELKGMFESFVNQLQRQGKKFEDSGVTTEQFIEQYKPVAENRVRGYYIVDAIATLEKIDVSDDDIEERFKTISANTGQPLPKVKEYYTNNKLTEGLRMQILHEKAIDFVVSKAKIKSKKPKK